MKYHYGSYKSILSAKNGMNLYRGCTHGCIYCDSRSECYDMQHDFENKDNEVGLPCGNVALHPPHRLVAHDCRLERLTIQTAERGGFPAERSFGNRYSEVEVGELAKLLVPDSGDTQRTDDEGFADFAELVQFPNDRYRCERFPGASAHIHQVKATFGHGNGITSLRHAEEPQCVLVGVSLMCVRLGADWHFHWLDLLV